MKKIIKTFMYFCAASLLFFSCEKKNNVQMYSCDPKLNDWAASSNARLTSFNREDLVLLMSIDSQLAIFRTLTPEQKCNIWKQKLQLVINDQNLTVAEKNHVQIAYNYLEPSFFVDSNSLNSLNSWSLNWANDAVNQFGWDSVRLFLISETIMTPSELNHLLNFIHLSNGGNPQNIGGGPDNLPNCNCRSSIACQWLVENCEKKENTCAPMYNCGLFGTSRCSGRCSGGLLSTLPPLYSSY